MSLKEGVKKFFGAFLLPMDELDNKDDLEAARAANQLFGLLDKAMRHSTTFEAFDSHEGVVLLVARFDDDEFHLTTSEFEDSMLIVYRNYGCRSTVHAGGASETDLLSAETLWRLHGYVQEAMTLLSESERQAAEALLGGPSREIYDDESQRYV